MPAPKAPRTPKPNTRKSRTQTPTPPPKRRHYPLSARPQRLHPDDVWDPINDTTVGERIVQLVGIGTPTQHAGAAVGLSEPEVRNWLRAGINVLTQDANGRDWSSFTHDERALANFAYAVLTSQGDWIARQHAQLEQASRGGHKVTTIVERQDATGTLISREIRETAQAADPKVIMWRLERMFPGVYGAHATLDILGVDVSNEPDTRERLRDRLADLGRRLALPPGKEPDEA